MPNEYKLNMEISTDGSLDKNLISFILQDALLLYAAKSGQKLLSGTLAIYENTFEDIVMPEFSSNSEVS